VQRAFYIGWLIFLTACTGHLPRERPHQPGDEGVTASTSSAEALAAFRTGQALVGNFHLPEAVEKFELAASIDPDFALALAYAGAHKKGPEGMAQLQRAIALSGNLPLAERLLIHKLMAGELGAGAIVTRRMIQ